ncbi:PCYCGC motif-containing (lipo)protein [Aneurinibacillus sp. REN35]|uniref:PCYCGC motif-containing (lipo)protein n=1 Tax=Aneurinibacillus sp. REN35 TaxID=3237286 RepID=UPI003529A4FA
MKIRTKKWFFAAAASLLVLGAGLSGCSSKEEAAHGGTQAHQEQLAGGDILETTAGRDQLPSFLKNFDPQVAKVYQAVGYNHTVIEHMACYCGCGDSVGHKSNLDCFINEVKPDGKIVWNSHGTTCANCMNIAAESIVMKQEGKSLLDIRKYIDNKYKEGFAKPTPTPMPTA